MKILWFTNIFLPEAAKLFGDKINPFGGWLVNASQALANYDNVKLSIAAPKTEQFKINSIAGEKINYWVYPWNDKETNQNSKSRKELIKMICEIGPEVVHIFGTEYSHSLAVVDICNDLNIKCVISIQGLVSVYAKHYLAHLHFEIQKGRSLRDFLRGDSLVKQRDKYLERGKTEIKALKKVNHIIGRTTWDKACTEQINPNAEYHFCNESLRDEFYKHEWSLTDCEKYSIFASQASYPIKGVHLLLEAMPYIVKRFPKTRLYIAGYDITKSRTIINRLKMSTYVKYITRLIEDNNLESHVTFTGLLNEKQMCNRYLKSNVFVCPSSIENSPNSLGEAMILGVPCIASDVGGVSDMLNHKQEGFVYQADAPYMLAHYICEIFKNKDLALSFSKKAREHALKTHDRVINTNRLIEIYNDIIHLQT